MTLIYDKRDELVGQPALHALIAGVSFYKHLPGGDGQVALNTYGMSQLSSPALSAYAISQWLLKLNINSQLPVPLGTVRVLLSPSIDEIDREPALNGLTNRCIRNNFAVDIHDWRLDARQSSDNFTFFYFSGHGVQRKKDDAIILFEDFGFPYDGPLNFAATMDNIFYGMAPPANPTEFIAQNQLYLVDACRIQPNKFVASDWMNVPDLWAVDRKGIDNRSAPIFYAAVPGAEAQGRPGEISFFCEALLNCLNRTGAEYKQDPTGTPKWQVSSVTLVRALKAELDVLNKQYQTSQDYATSGYFKDMLINYLNSAPDVDIDIEIDPTGAPFFNLTVTDPNTNEEVLSFPAPFLSPQKKTIPAGVYRFAAQIVDPPKPPFRDCLEYCPITPPRSLWRARIK